MLDRAVLLGDGTVIKTQEPRASQRERLRTLAGRDVGLQSGLFLVPQIVAFDDSRGAIEFQRMPLIGLRRLLTDGDRGSRLIGRAARALAAIHGQMKPNDVFNVVYSGTGSGIARAPVPLHGDFGMRNICFLPASDDMAIIDWANADWTAIDADLGPPEIDIAVFLVSLFHRRPFSPWGVIRRHELARHFLETYSAASPQGLDLGSLRSIVATIGPQHMQSTRRLKGPLRALAYSHSTIDLSLFLWRLPGTAFASAVSHGG